ncbi:transcriptional regulator ovo-like [Uloborus diversus]|uniref:transcriptional regulator ovo-like n=1 Tax=Uloborus diversus TaxID=327109 RepID=UPI002409FA83|nr:transcriptional regulator ovo-like [Uloborus diversus]
MPRSFLVRKTRKHLKTGACGLVTPPPSPEQLTIVPQTKTEEHTIIYSNPLITSWTETCQKQRIRAEGGRGEAGTTPPISPCNLPSPPVMISERYLPHTPTSIRTSADEASLEEPSSSSSSTPPPMRPAYMPVSVIQSLATQDQPLDCHVPRIRSSEIHEHDSDDSKSHHDEEQMSHDWYNMRVQHHLSQACTPLPDSQEDSHSDSYHFDMRPMSPADSDSNSSKSPDSLDERGEKMAMVPSLPVRLALLLQKLGLPTDVPLEFVNGGHGIKNPLLPRSHRHSSSQEMAPLSSPTPDILSVGEMEAGRLSCRVCGKTFGLQRLLNRHMKCHSDMKRYLCTFCCKGFNDTFDLKRHTRTHTGVRPYKCNMCEKSFTQRCSLESHTLKVHGIQHQYAYKERRAKVYVCEECGHTTTDPEVHYLHLKQNHPYSPALLKFYDKRHFKFSDGSFPLGLLRVHS